MDEVNRIICLGSDHAGFGLKEKVKKHLLDQKYIVEDYGAYAVSEEDDYPDFVQQVARAVSRDFRSYCGIIFGGSGQGEAMVANAFPAVRCAVYYGGDAQIIELSRTHNDSNILSLGARFVSDEQTIACVDLWLEKRFSEQERHLRRINKIEKSKKIAAMPLLREVAKRKFFVIPAILDSTLETVVSKMTTLEGETIWIQIDVKDGVYVEGKTFDINEVYLGKYPFLFEAHLMVQNPEQWIDDCSRAGFSRVIFHPETSGDAELCIQSIRGRGMQPGIALSPNENIHSYAKLFGKVDMVMVMGVVPGQSGQEFLPDTFDRIEQCRLLCPESVLVGVDGGVQKGNIHQIIFSGADSAAVGSGIFNGSQNPGRLLKEMNSLLEVGLGTEENRQ